MILNKKQLPLTTTDYDKLTDSYEGSGGFITGEHLTRHKRETEENFNIRKLISFYLNYVRVVVDSHVKAVFSTEPERENVNDVYYEGFLLDADANGTELNRWMKQAATRAKLHGCVLIVVDNFESVEETVELAMQNRAYPYVYYIEPSRFYDYTQDKIGRLSSFTYTETSQNENGVEETVYRKWDKTSCVLMRADGSEITRWEHGLGSLPCFLLYGSDTPASNIVPVSEFLQVSRVNRAIFNICSEIREIQRHQGFNILTFPGEPPESGTLKVGTENVLYYPETATHEPKFIAPDPAPLEALVAFMDRLVEEIYRMACVTYTQQYASDQSGESKKWTFHITKQVLVDFSINCEKAENRIAFLFGKYLGKDLGVQVTYNKKYGVEDVDVDLQRALLALEVGLGTEGNAQVRSKAARQYFADMPDTEINRIVDVILAEKEVMQQDKAADAALRGENEPA